MSQDLIKGLDRLGIEITEDDIPVILRLGIDRYLNGIRFNATEENMSGIYIILNTIRENIALGNNTESEGLI